MIGPDVFFSSTSDGVDLMDKLVELLRTEIRHCDPGDAVCISGMVFAFTERRVADTLFDLACRYSNVLIRLIGDWKQGAPHKYNQLPRLARQGRPNLQIRYKLDQPYVRPPSSGDLIWSYRHSLGLLHHKTLSIRRNGIPQLLICGTANWASGARRNYENLFTVRHIATDWSPVLLSVEREFEALWSDGFATLSPSEASHHYRLIQAELAQPRTATARATKPMGLRSGLGAHPQGLHSARADDATQHVKLRRTTELASPSAPLIAFSARRPCESRATAGYHPLNRRRFVLNSGIQGRGEPRPKPLTPTNLALSLFAATRADDRLYLAMHGFSARVAEYSALLSALRRGVQCFVVLDGHASADAAVRLQLIAHEEGLPLRLVTTGRVMHQKYLVHQETATILTGTANMSTDARDRHSEHRILIPNNPDLATKFIRDLQTIAARQGKNSEALFRNETP